MQSSALVDNQNRLSDLLIRFILFLPDYKDCDFLGLSNP
ncbi:hypothetical protein AO376_1318 [Moraxella catarrhalis]|nr:hypothetical protein AO376_1318 [Moraxella catarrhalis]OAV21758.1 hypothetical protein AO374_0091 [Moraxella catarrhalis]